MANQLARAAFLSDINDGGMQPPNLALYHPDPGARRFYLDWDLIAA